MSKVKSTLISDGTSYQSFDGLSRVSAADPRLEELYKDVEKLREELVELILLDSPPEAVSVYGMTVDEYLNLSGNARL